MNLLYALMLESANDAAVAIALFVSGSVENFSEKMNEKARELELSQTFYQNPHGLSAENHRSSAEDLAKLMAYAMKNETFAEIVATKTKTISAPGDGTRYLSNHNRLLRTFPLCIGGKTGYTKEAGRCLVTAAKKDGKTLVCATLNAPDDWNDHVALLNHGFSLYSVKNVLAEEEIQVEIPVVGGVSSSVCLFNASSLQLSLRAEDRFTYVLEAPMFFYAPLTAEDRVLGEAVCFVNGEEVARISLYGKEGVPVREETPGFWKSLWIMIKNIFR